jgi:hypothetical protein
MSDIAMASDLWQQVDGAMTLLMRGGPTPKNLVSALKAFDRVIAEAPDGSDALKGALYGAGCIYAVMGDIIKSNEYIFASGLVDLPRAGVRS